MRVKSLFFFVLCMSFEKTNAVGWAEGVFHKAGGDIGERIGHGIEYVVGSEMVQNLPKNAFDTVTTVGKNVWENLPSREELSQYYEKVQKFATPYYEHVKNSLWSTQNPDDEGIRVQPNRRPEPQDADYLDDEGIRVQPNRRPEPQVANSLWSEGIRVQPNLNLGPFADQGREMGLRRPDPQVANSLWRNFGRFADQGTGLRRPLA